MNNYIITTDKTGTDRIIRIRYPICTATVYQYYEAAQTNGPCSKSFDLEDDKFKICIDEQMDDAPESKIKWALDKAIHAYKKHKYENRNA